MIRYTDIRKQYLISMILYVIVFSHGNTMTWVLSNSKINSLSPTYFQHNQILLFRAYAGGHVLGAVICLCAHKIIGLRLSVFMLMIPQTIYWLILTLAIDRNDMKVANMFSGFVSAGTMITMPLYIAEIADRRHRGTLIVMILLFRSLGQLTNMGRNIHTLGEIFTMPSRSLSFAFIWLNSSFFFVYLHTPETPLHHLRNNNYKAAEQSWRYFNLGNRERLTAAERVRMKRALTGQKEALQATQIRHTWQVFSSPGNLRNLVICVALNLFSAFSSLVGVQTTPIIMHALIDQDAIKNNHAYVVSMLEMLGIAFGVLLVDRIGRRALMICSSASAMLSASIMIHFTRFNDVYSFHGSPQSLPFTCMLVIIISACSGMISITMLNVAELFDLQVRYYSAALVAIPAGFFQYSSLSLFFILHNYYGVHWSFLMKALGCLGCLVVSIFWLPETIGKELFPRKSKKTRPQEAIGSSVK